MLLVKRLNKSAILPTVANPNEDCGFDVRCLNAITVPAKGFAVISTGIAAQYKDALGTTCGMMIEGRGSLGKEGIFKLAGVQDGLYEGEIIVILGNLSDKDKHFLKGAKIAQLVAHKELADSVKEVKEFPLSGNRGTRGFGSSDTAKGA